jgi:DNA-directed RNA polymerase specialized sigma24 family protein
MTTTTDTNTTAAPRLTAADVALAHLLAGRELTAIEGGEALGISSGAFASRCHRLSQKCPGRLRRPINRGRTGTYSWVGAPPEA